MIVKKITYFLDNHFMSFISFHTQNKINTLLLTNIATK